MNSEYPANRKWTIRLVPWFLIIVFTILFIADVGAIIFNEEARCGATFLLILFIVFILVFEIVECTLDQDSRKVTIKRRTLFRKSTQEFSFGDVNTVTVQTSSDPESVTYSIAFVLNTGEMIPLTRYSSSGKAAKEKLAKKIINYIDLYSSSHVNASMNGEIRIEKEGESDGIPWKLAFVMGNDSLPQTRWYTSESELSTGFILLIPAEGSGSSKIPEGIFGNAIRMIYDKYLKMLDIDQTELPGFNTSQIFPGDSIGLNKRYTILTNNVEIFRSWLTASRIQILTDWLQTNPLKGKSATTDPHIALNNHMMRMTFRGKYNNQAEMDAINQLGARLVKG